jgi:hypothetical protein
MSSAWPSNSDSSAFGLFRIRVRPCGEGIVDTAGAGDLQTHHIQRDVRGLMMDLTENGVN